MANQRIVENAGNSLHQREEMLSTPEFLEPRRPSYLRKSIAWDNAFFSSDGNIYSCLSLDDNVSVYIFFVTLFNTLLCIQEFWILKNYLL